MMSAQMCLLALTRGKHRCAREGYETYRWLAPVSPLSCRRMRSNLWRVIECPTKIIQELNFILPSKEITLQIKARVRSQVLYLGACLVSASWSVKTSSYSSFSSFSCVAVSRSPWITFEFLLLPSLPSSYKYRSNSQQTAHKMSSLKIQLEIRCVSSHCYILNTHILILLTKWGHFAGAHRIKLLEG